MVMHPIPMDMETAPEEQQDKAAKTLYKLAINILRILLKTTIESPKKISTFFNEDVSAEEIRNSLKYERLLTRSKEWQVHFFQQLQEKNAITMLNGMVACKNRFFIDTLLHESLTSVGRLLPMICEAGGIPIPADMKIIVQKTIETPKEKMPSKNMEYQTEDIGDALEKDHQQQTETLSKETKSSQFGEAGQYILASLKHIQEQLDASLTYQEKFVENLVYVRERGDKLHEKLKSVSERLQKLESLMEVPITVDMPQLESVKNSVNSVGSAVGSMKKDIDSSLVAGAEAIGSAMIKVKQEIEKTVRDTAREGQTNEIMKMKASVARISGEFEALRELLLEESIGDSK
jgi:hypothetical protein